MNESLKQFLKKYQIKVLDDNKRVPLNYPDPNDYACSEELKKYMDREYGALLTIEIPEHVLHRLRIQDENFTLYGGSALTMLDHMVLKEEYEEQIRSTNIAVKDAFEQYQVLLALACKKQNEIK